jgi:hypothetical protein
MTYSPQSLQAPHRRQMVRNSSAARTRVAKSSAVSGRERTGAPIRRRANPTDHFLHQSGPRFSLAPSTNSATIIPHCADMVVPPDIRAAAVFPLADSHCRASDTCQNYTIALRVSGGLSQHIYGPLSLTIAINHTTPTAQASGAATHRISAARSNMGRSHG